jgi:cobalt-precorrin-5B (C1)-methyltransferase
LEVTISIPAGVELARQTLNPVLGVEGGLSVIGTTGVLRPMSEEGFKNSLVPQIDVARVAGFADLIFVPGKIGERIAVRWQLPREAMVQTSNFIGFMLEAAAKRDIKRIMLFGHIGKLVKVAAGVFYTHNRIADARLETMSAYAAAAGMSTQGVQQLLASNTTEDALAVLTAYNLRQTVCQRLAQQASMRAERYLFQKVQVGTVLVSLTGELLGMDDMAAQMGRAWGWEVQDET